MMKRSTRQNSSNESCRRARKILKRKKNEYLKKQIERNEGLKTSNEIRTIYGAVKYIN